VTGSKGSDFSDHSDHEAVPGIITTLDSWILPDQLPWRRFAVSECFCM